MNKKLIRRSVSIPVYLDEKIDLLKKQFSYRSKTDLIIELLELGIIKFNENDELLNNMRQVINKVDYLLKKLDEEL